MPVAPPFAPQAVVFDLDGLLVDSEPLWARAEQRVVESFGGRWSPGIQEILLGRAPLDAATALAAVLGVDDPLEVERRMVAAAVEEFTEGVPLRPGAAHLVESLHGLLPLAVATNSRRVIADLALTSTGLLGRMGAVVTAEDVRRGKPAPDPYRTACLHLGVDPARTLAFEDSPLGAASARAAGLWVIGCPSFDGIRLEEAHTRVVSLTDVDPAALLRAPAARDGASTPTGRLARRGD